MMTQEPEETIRSFVAITLPQNIKQGLMEVSARIRDHLKHARTRVVWVKPESVHLTLKFLGPIESVLVDPIMQRLEKAVVDMHPFQIAIGDIGVFPNHNEPRVIWLGVEKGADMLCCLQKKVDYAIQDLGFDIEKREFSPHLTLGRIKSLGSRGEILRALRVLQGVAIDEMEVGHITLMKSKLTPNGAIYTELGVVGLKQ